MKNLYLTVTLLLISSISSINIAQAAGTINWGYYQHGQLPVVLPESWAEYYPDCNGSSQSPINISNAQKFMFDENSFEYQDTQLRVSNNGHSLQIDYEPGSSVYVGYEDQRVLQFHFHTPSENVVNKKQYPMEMHIVHANTAGALTVVAVFIEEGKANETFEKIISNAPLLKGEFISTESISVNDLMPEHLERYYKFSGSLTTPPCSEGVTWLVQEKTITFSAAQIAAFEHIFHINNRPVQATNGRTIYSNQY